MEPDTAPPRQYVAAIANITNRCNLRCSHCFVSREANPNDPRGEMDTPTMLARLGELQERHNINTML